jgi:hypothetical protein
MKIELKSGDGVSFQEFELKDENLRKINIDWDGEEGEGLWAYFSDDDIIKHDADTTDGVAVVALANAPLAFYPHNFWGAFMPVKFRGTSRPYCNLSELTGAPLFHSDVSKASE